MASDPAFHAARRVLAARDAADPLAGFRARFELPEGLIYLDGNSLGALPKSVPARLERVLREEWGRGLVRSWNEAGWFELPQRVGEKIARLVGAAPGQVVAADSTSVNLFKVLAAAAALAPGRRAILSERDNFPTDLHIAEGLAGLLGDRELRLAERPEALAAMLDEHTAALMLTQVNYRTGALHDVAALTRLAHRHGAFMVLDLAHSAGVLPVELDAWEVDFAVGCGYKYLNGGPGAPAFVYVAQRHQARFAQPLSGWMGHAAPFAFEPHYRPAAGVSRYLCGTPPILSLAALDEALELALAAPLAEVRAKSLALADLFIELVEAHCPGHGLRLVTPREHERRGSQVSFVHPQGYAIVQALAARGIVGDFRAPDVMRFGFTPLYLRFVDIWDAVMGLQDVLETGAWDAPAFRERKAVT